MDKEYIDKIKKQLDKIKCLQGSLDHKFNRSVMSFSRFEINNDIYVLTHEVSQLKDLFQTFTDYVTITYNNDK